MENKENIKKSGVKISISRMSLLLIMLLVVVLGGTFAWFSYASRQSALVLTIGDFNNTQVKLTPYQFRGTMGPVNEYTSGVYSQVTAVNNSASSVSISFYYYVNSITPELIENGLKYTIESSNTLDGEYEWAMTGDFTGYNENDERYKISDIKMTGNTTIYYRVYLWVDSSAGEQNLIQNSVLDVELNANIYIEPNAPVLDDGMIPVTISDDGVVTTIESDDPKWYDYENKEWANIVLVTDSSRSDYREKGITVSSSDILAYYVWIPRYKYKIVPSATASGDVLKERTFNVVFESASASMSNGTQVGTYKTHPAFWWDNDNDGVVDSGETVAGIWVGKFETTGSDTIPTVLPNSYALNDQSIGEQFASSRLFSASGNSYGLSNVTTNAHMMKNSEWGAVAYLSHSDYGINQELYLGGGYLTGGSTGTTDNCSSDSDIVYSWLGQTIDYVTIGDYVSDRTLGTYASTTGNVTGIYDMAGGHFENVMGNYDGLVGDSGFSVLPESKYYNLYSAEQFPDTPFVNIEYCTIATCGGHALSETASWYGDMLKFVYEERPWFSRGTDADDENCYVNGLFVAETETGKEFGESTWRSVLVPYEEVDYTLVAHPNGGTLATTTGWTSVSGRATSTKAIEYGSTYGTLPTVTRTGYTFNGWSTSMDLGDISWSASSDTTFSFWTLLYDAYPGVTYTITMDEAALISGSGSQFSIAVYDFTASKNYGTFNVDFDTDIEVKIPVPSTAIASNDLRILVYAGVAGSTGGNQVEYNNVTIYGNSLGSSFNYDSSTNVSVAENQMMFANYDSNLCTVTYYNGATKLGSSSHTAGVPSTTTTFANLGGTITNSTFGWSFYGWSTSSSSRTSTYTNGGNVTCNSDITLYAVYNRTITFKSGASAGTTNSTATQYWNPSGTTNGTHLSSVSSPALTAVTNWTSKGWRADTTATTLGYNPNSTIYPASGTSNTLYGVYERTLTFKSGISTISSSTKTQYLNAYNNTVSSVTTPSLTSVTNWSSKGWKTEIWRGSSNYNASTSYSISYDVGNTLYGVYTRSFTFKYGANGGSGTMSNSSATAYVNSGYSSGTSAYVYGKTSSNSFTKTGYTFSNWGTSTSGGTTYSAGAETKYEFDITSSSAFSLQLYAQWTPITYTVVYTCDEAGLTCPTTQTQTATYNSWSTFLYPVKTSGTTISFDKGGGTNFVSSIGATSKTGSWTFKGWKPSTGFDVSTAMYQTTVSGSQPISWSSISTVIPANYRYMNLRPTTGTVNLKAVVSSTATVTLPAITPTNSTYSCVWQSIPTCSNPIGYAPGKSIKPTSAYYYACCGINVAYDVS